MIKGRPYSSNARDIAAREGREEEERGLCSLFAFDERRVKNGRKRGEQRSLEKKKKKVRSLSLPSRCLHFLLLFLFFPRFLLPLWLATEVAAVAASRWQPLPLCMRQSLGRWRRRATLRTSKNRRRSRVCQSAVVDQLVLLLLPPMAPLLLLLPHFLAPLHLGEGQSACC